MDLRLVMGARRILLLLQYIVYPTVRSHHTGKAQCRGGQNRGVPDFSGARASRERLSGVRVHGPFVAHSDRDAEFDELGRFSIEWTFFQRAGAQSFIGSTYMRMIREKLSKSFGRFGHRYAVRLP